MSAFKPVLTQHIYQQDCHTLPFYQSVGGYTALEKVLTMDPEDVIDVVKNSNLRGRGGAGFPAGIKWGFLPKDMVKPTYLINNADESEPGTFKDRLLINKAPHQMLEGMLIAAYAIRCNLAFIYIRGEFYKEAEVLEKVLSEAYAANLLGKNILGSKYDLDVIVHRGAGAYICGEETALIESLEGKRGCPRLKPPFPALEGYLKCPTIVNNVETLSNLPHIINRGAEWFRSIGPEKGPGPKLYCVSGCVNSPGVFEEPMGTSLKKLIYENAGGIKNDNQLKAVLPGGSSSAILTAEEAVTLNMDFDSLMDAKTMLGSAGIIVMDDTVNMVQACLNIARFYAHESCGQCTPCREGTTWLVKMLTRMVQGGGKAGDIKMLYEITDNIGGLIDFSKGSFGKTICPFGEAVAWPIRSFVEKFESEFINYIPQQETVA
ncbi:MAG TPA: NADH-quinone oxidoreductase subunit NuoF [Candidatus Marinimicrobia bacterium]|jgi:NADH-quinone oxidoreductase subunit F|nr:NADH-quinone oxidoreductase subunit F [Candidatus Neomarinimicrobiota bacterium]HJL75597.1 NADH-quinone oxidoreductase subunit NuoF [Candidatus Neomarinimicrobiota bacterium]HJM69332.1 NADH-quinone oxidoreductase subunit NuoF [Candidatus Neomarinimicrobiota bacterium]